MLVGNHAKSRKWICFHKKYLFWKGEFCFLDRNSSLNNKLENAQQIHSTSEIAGERQLEVFHCVKQTNWENKKCDFCLRQGFELDHPESGTKCFRWNTKIDKMKTWNFSKTKTVSFYFSTFHEEKSGTFLSEQMEIEILILSFPWGGSRSQWQKITRKKVYYPARWLLYPQL